MFCYRTTTTTATPATTSLQETTTTLRPKRTTTPIPSTENPLLRFYPPEDEFDIGEDSREEQFRDDMINDAPLHDKRDASPWASAASSRGGNGITHCFVTLSLVTFTVLCATKTTTSHIK